MPSLPCSASMCCCSKTSRTSPAPLREHSRPSYAVMIPAASWPRCCSTVSASYRRWLTGLVPTIPTIPHMLRYSSLDPLIRLGARVPGEYFTLADHATQHIRRAFTVRDQRRSTPPRLAVQTQRVTQHDKQADHHQAAQKAEYAAEKTVGGAEYRQSHHTPDDGADATADQHYREEYDAA